MRQPTLTTHPRHLAARAAGRAVTLIEMMVVIALAALIISLAAPSFSEYIVTQRVRSVHAQLATDLQYARSEAVARGSFVGVRFQFTTGSTGASCYVIFSRPEPGPTNPVSCDCLAAPGLRCAANPGVTTELRTVTIPNELRVNLRLGPSQPDTMNYDPRTGALKFQPIDETILVAQGFIVDTSADADRKLRVVVKPSGRPELCAPTGSTLGGTPCAP